MMGVCCGCGRRVGEVHGTVLTDVVVTGPIARTEVRTVCPRAYGSAFKLVSTNDVEAVVEPSKAP